MKAEYVLYREKQEALILPVYLEEQMVVFLKRKRQEMTEQLCETAEYLGISKAKMKHLIGMNKFTNEMLEALGDQPDIIPEFVNVFNFSRDCEEFEEEIFKSLY